MYRLLFLGPALMVAYTVKYEDVTPGGYKCGEHQTARVYYPDSSDKSPLISFAHGYTFRGRRAYSRYVDMNTAIVAKGYVVIVPESSKYPFECPDIWKDQVHSIEWIRNSSLANKIDWGKQVGILGHSMGGGATYHSAGQADVVKAQNIGVAVALHPQITSPTAIQPITNSQVPIFFGTGSKDNIVSPSSVKSAYTNTSGVAKVFTEIKGAGHFEPVSGMGTSNRHTPYVIAMFDCHLNGDKDQCLKVYGKGKDALCSGKVNMTDCECSGEDQCAHPPPGPRTQFYATV